MLKAVLGFGLAWVIIPTRGTADVREVVALMLCWRAALNFYDAGAAWWARYAWRSQLRRGPAQS